MIASPADDIHEVISHRQKTQDKKTWISKENENKTQMVTYILSCPRCPPPPFLWGSGLDHRCRKCCDVVCLSDWGEFRAHMERQTKENARYRRKRSFIRENGKITKLFIHTPPPPRSFFLQPSPTHFGECYTSFPLYSLSLLLLQHRQEQQQLAGGRPPSHHHHYLAPHIPVIIPAIKSVHSACGKTHFDH